VLVSRREENIHTIARTTTSDTLINLDQKHKAENNAQESQKQAAAAGSSVFRLIAARTSEDFAIPENVIRMQKTQSQVKLLLGRRIKRERNPKSS
jgi:hypothetical protein